eukprot:TRINITY_DN3248_c0_g4_i1.p1 TRINITY_DN3248_c0_g4~~TRINITY_DN3248_c0_g4_i1.p1  ORF type:complete len:62 (-),score=8.79 TRINITY_DN3248_c0_g4_i1:875-1060(-)
MNDGASPLYGSCEHGHLGIIKMLLDHGANVNLKTEQGLAPIDIARTNGHTQIVELLHPFYN